MLLNILSRLSWPLVLQDEIGQLQNRLDDNAAPDTWLDVVERISHLVVSTLESVQKEADAAGAFLSQLTERLNEFDRHMASQSEARQASRHAGETLGSQVRSQVGDISTSVRNSTDLQQLQQSVLGSLDKIQGHVFEHLEKEEQRLQQAEVREQVLRGNLQEMEQEALELRRKIAQTEQDALRDALTGLPNRRAYEQRVAQELARWKRFDDPLVLFVCDIDNFKQVNDRFGHKAGDKAIRIIGMAMKKRLRETDFIARYGGEEFVVLFPGAKLEDAKNVAESMRQAVEGLGMHSNKEPVVLTISGGLSEFREGDSVDAVFERADKALYQAKGAGKNQCLVG